MAVPRFVGPTTAGQSPSDYSEADGHAGDDIAAAPHAEFHHELKSFVEAAVARVTRSQVGELAVVDGGDQESYTAAVASFPAAVAEVVYETGNAVGVDIKSLLGAGQGRK